MNSLPVALSWSLCWNVTVIIICYFVALVFFSINAYISFIKSDQAMRYRACKTCNKKVFEASWSDYWCEACGDDDDQCSLSKILNLNMYQSNLILVQSWNFGHFLMLFVWIKFKRVIYADLPYNPWYSHLKFSAWFS